MEPQDRNAGSADGSEQRGRRWMRLATPAAAIVGAVLTTIAFLAAHGWETGRTQRQFVVPATQHAAEFHRSLELEVAILESLRSFHAASSPIDAAGFHAFVADHLRNNSDIVSLAWLERVTAAGREDFEAKERPDHAGNYVVIECSPEGPCRAQQRDEYFPVRFAEPSDMVGNQLTLGYDHASIEPRRAAIEEAKRTRSLVALGPTALTSMGMDSDASKCAPPMVLIFYLPVFARPADPDAELIGCFAGLFLIDRLFDDVTERIDQGYVQLDLFMASAESGSGRDATPLPVYSSATAGGTLPRFDEHKGDPDAYSTSWTYAGREWTAVCTPTPALLRVDAQWYSWFVVLLGLAATAGGVFAVKRLTSDRYRIARELKQFWRMSAEMLCVLDVDGRLRRVNPAWRSVLGASEELRVGSLLTDLVHPDDRAATADALRRLAQMSSTLTFETRLRAADGQWRWIQWNAAPTDDRTVVHAVARDVTDARTTLEELEHRATIDPLTLTLNRGALFDKLGVEIHRAQRYGAPLSVALVDLDHFKQVNDVHGHPAGDEVLRAFGQILRSTLRESDVVGRFGGDEFVIVMPETTPDTARQVAERLLESLHAETGVRAADGTPIPLRASLGVAPLSGDIKGATELIARADAALYQAKAAGRNRVM